MQVDSEGPGLCGPHQDSLGAPRVPTNAKRPTICILLSSRHWTLSTNHVCCGMAVSGAVRCTPGCEAIRAEMQRSIDFSRISTARELAL